MDQSNPIAIRFTAPNRYDKAPFGSICKLVGEKQETYYLQVSHEEEHAQWIKSGDLFEKIFEPAMTNESFIQQCIDAYLQKPESFSEFIKKLLS